MEIGLQTKTDFK